MRIIPSPYSNKSEVPRKLKISFEAVFDYLEKTPPGKNNEIQLTDAMREMVKEHAMYGMNCRGALPYYMHNRCASA